MWLLMLKKITFAASTPSVVVKLRFAAGPPHA
jgi:hypothetical protein